MSERVPVTGIQRRRRAAHQHRVGHELLEARRSLQYRAKGFVRLAYIRRSPVCHLDKLSKVITRAMKVSASSDSAVGPNAGQCPPLRTADIAMGSGVFRVIAAWHAEGARRCRY